MPISPLPTLMLCALLVSLLGAAALPLALRGRLVAAGPHCRKCRFDLRGLALARPTPDDPAPVCPECGRAIAGPADVRNGLRERSRALLTVGLLLAMGPWAAVGAAAFANNRANSAALKPTWWLLAEVRALQPASVGPQLTELRARMQNGTLAASHRARLIDRALQVQAVRSVRWITEWGDVIEAAAAAGVLTDEQAASYARHAPVVVVSARPRIAVGDQLPIRLAQVGGRIGNAPFGPQSLQFGSSLQSIRIGERTLPVQAGGIIQSGVQVSGACSTVSCQDLFIGEPGVFDIVTTWKFNVGQSGSETPTAEWTEDHTVRVIIDPAGTDHIELVVDEALAAQVRAALAAPRGVRVTPALDRDPARQQVWHHIECRNVPVDLAFEIVLRERPDPAAPDRALREWHTGRSTFRAGGTITLGTGTDVPTIDVAAVDIVLRPSKAAARDSIDIYRMWAREIVIENVPVHLPPDDGGAAE